MYCNNCGSRGHVFKTCKDPITSCGILLLKDKKEPMKLPTDPKSVSVLMVRRKDSMAYMEFMRGKYDVKDTAFITRLVSNMTIEEQKLISTEEFDTLWLKLWGQGRDTHSIEYEISKQQYETIDREGVVSTVPSSYKEPEWGFPKGRRMRSESDIACAIREFGEETNIPREAYSVLKNIVLEETFTGLNGIPYRHIYYVALLKNPELIDLKQKFTPMQRREISGIGWKSFTEADALIRPHHVERHGMLTQLKDVIETFEAE